MAITYPRSFPSGISIASSRMGLVPNQSVFVSELTQKVSVQSIGSGTADRWEGLWTTADLTQAQHRELTAWLLSLRGQEKTFYAHDPDRISTSGVASTGTSFPAVNGAGQTGRSIVTDGWLASTSGLMKAGDYIQIAAQYYILTEDVSSDGLGNATLSVEPAIRTSPADNTAVTIYQPKMIARLVESATNWETGHRSAGPISFAWREVI